MYYFVKKDYGLKKQYDKGLGIFDLFQTSSSGVKTSNDENLVSFTKNELTKNISDFFNLEPDLSLIQKYSYKPFIDKYIYFDDALIGRSRKNIMSNFIKKDNYTICLMRNLVNTEVYNTVFISKNIIDINYYGFQTYSLPLYLYPQNTEQQSFDQSTERTPNLNTEIVKQIADKLGLKLTSEKETTKDSFAPIDILDYIYAVLHSPTYREKYKEFLKIDFPRVPYPKDKATFWQLVKLGGAIREIHLLVSSTVEKYITQYPEDGDNVVLKPRFDSAQRDDNKGKVYINDTQYFDNVPQVAWEFYIGGYQPAQKWLKDRKERKLEFDDILHYQKIIVALSETDRLMKEVDKIEIE
jgi:predicted helicase